MTPAPDFDLSARNTLGLEAKARFGGVIAHAGEIIPMIEFARAQGLPFHLVGAGSNCVLAEQINAVIGVLNLKGRSLDNGSPGKVRVIARAGESWPELVAWTVENGIGGLENLAGIPGTVGAAPVQNIGAYGVELSDVFESLVALDTGTGRFRKFTRQQCRFAYRQSRFKEEPGRYVVIEVTLSLPRPSSPVLSYPGLTGLSPASDPRTIMNRVLALRSAKLPDWRVTGNAGSFFHNPVVPATLEHRFRDMPRHPVEGGIKLSAGWLIEACGLKGRRFGDAGFSDKHALVVVNHGNATFRDVSRLAECAVREVKNRFGITLVQEPVIFA